MPALIVVCLLLVLVVIHEAGHALAAAATGLEFDTIFLGVPLPKLSKTFHFRGRKLTISPLLLGGGVNVNDRELYSSPLWKKVSVAAAGPFANFGAGALVAIATFGWRTGLEVSKEFLFASVQALAMVFRGAVGIDQISSPVGVVSLSSQVLAIGPGLLGVVFIWLLLNFAIGATNLLPIPALDGGQIVVGALCSLFGNRPKVVRGAQLLNACFLVVLLIAVMALTVRDVAALVGR